MATLLLNHFNGSDGASIPDDEIPGVTWAQVVGNAEVDTAYSQFGGSSVLFPGNWVQGKQIRSSSFGAVNSGNWTAEGWFRNAGSGGVCQFTLEDASGTEVGYMRCAYGTASNVEVQLINAAYTDDAVYELHSASLDNTNFNHCAFVRNNAADTYEFFLNGLRIFSVSNSDNGYEFARVRLIGDYDAFNVSGWWDEVRVTSEVKYSGSTYTVPTTEFTLGSTINLESFSAEFDREHLAGYASLNLIPASSEYSGEWSGSGVVLTQSDVQSEYDFEAGSPGTVQNIAAAVDGQEYDWEDSQAQDAVPGVSEYDYEWQSVGIPTDYFIGAGQTPLEMDWEALSPGISSRTLLRGVTPHRRRIVAGRRTKDRRLAPQFRVEVTASRRTEVMRNLR